MTQIIIALLSPLSIHPRRFRGWPPQPFRALCEWKIANEIDFCFRLCRVFASSSRSHLSKAGIHPCHDLVFSTCSYQNTFYIVFNAFQVTCGELRERGPENGWENQKTRWKKEVLCRIFGLFVVVFFFTNKEKGGSRAQKKCQKTNERECSLGTAKKRATVRR